MTLDDLAQRAEWQRPRLFAVYGLSGTREILGWGMDFPGRDLALLHLPDDSVTHHSSSAERTALSYSMLGDVGLTWFDA
jgi:hypothetical protein